MYHTRILSYAQHHKTVGVEEQLQLRVGGASHCQSPPRRDSDLVLGLEMVGGEVQPQGKRGGGCTNLGMRECALNRWTRQKCVLLSTPTDNIGGKVDCPGPLGNHAGTSSPTPPRNRENLSADTIGRTALPMFRVHLVTCLAALRPGGQLRRIN